MNNISRDSSNSNNKATSWLTSNIAMYY